MAERQWEPDRVVSPAEMLQEWMEERGLSVRLLALVCRSHMLAPTLEETLSAVEGVLSRKPLTEKIARILARGTRISPQFWLALEHNYRYGLAHGKTNSEAGDGMG